MADVSDRRPRRIISGFDVNAARQTLANGQFLTQCLVALVARCEHDETFISHQELGEAMLREIEVWDNGDGLNIRLARPSLGATDGEATT